MGQVEAGRKGMGTTCVRPGVLGAIAECRTGGILRRIKSMLKEPRSLLVGKINQV
jgi:hypothetical protein